MARTEFIRKQYIRKRILKLFVFFMDYVKGAIRGVDKFSTNPFSN